MRIAFVGDVHGSHKRPALELFVRELAPDVMLQVGDLQDYRAMPAPMVFCRGNHESFEVLTELRSGRLKVPNLTLLDDGDRLSFGGLSVMSVGGNWSPSGKKGHPRFIRHEYLAQLRRAHADIMMSHETPIRFSDGKHDRLTLGPLRDLCIAMAPRFWISGHHHHHDVEQLGRTTIISLSKWPRGWGWIDTDERGGPVYHRFEPHDRAAYDEAMFGWRAAEARQKDILYPLDKRGGRYGL